MSQTQHATTGYGIFQQDPNLFNYSDQIFTQNSSEPNHYSVENDEAYEDVEEKEYEENEEEGDAHPHHQEQTNVNNYQENQQNDQDEIDSEDQTNSSATRGEKSSRNVPSRESRKRQGENGLSQVKENPEDDEGDEGLINELQALAKGTPKKSEVKSKGEKSPWDPRYFSDRFNFEQLNGKPYNFNKVSPKKFHKHYEKFTKEFLDKKEENLEQKRKEKKEAEVAGLQDKPKLIAKANTKPYVPLLDRTPLMDARRDRELEKIKQEKEEKLLKELEELTFAPKINSNSRKMASPSKEKIMKIYLQTRFNHHSQMSDRKGSRSPHTPKINSKSRNIADTTREHASRDVVDRLYIDAGVGKHKKDKLVKQLTPTFSPNLNRNTRKIAKQIERNYNTYDDRNYRSVTEGDVSGYESQHRRLATEGDNTQNLSDLDQSTDYELLHILKQFNEMLKLKNENPITIEQLSALMSSYSKKRTNSSQRHDNQDSTVQDTYEEERQLHTDRPLRSNLNEQNAESFNSQGNSLRAQTPNSQRETPKKSSNFLAPRGQAEAQSPGRSQSPLSPTKKSGALMSHLIQNPRFKNKNDDKPTTTINQTIMQKALKASPGKGARASPLNHSKNESKDTKNVVEKSRISETLNKFEQLEKATQTSKKAQSEQAKEEEQWAQDNMEEADFNQDQDEIVKEYVLRNEHEEEKHKGHARLPVENQDNENNQSGEKHYQESVDELHSQKGQEAKKQNSSAYATKNHSQSEARSQSKLSEYVNKSINQVDAKSKNAVGSRQSVRGSNFSSRNSLHNEEQGYTSKYKGKSIYATQKEGQKKNDSQQEVRESQKLIPQLEEYRAPEHEEIQPEANESQKGEDNNHSFSTNTIENHGSFDDNQAHQTEQRMLEDLVSVASKASSIRHYETEPPKRTVKKPQIQCEIVTTETIEIRPSSTKKNNFSFSMDGGDKSFVSASGTDLKQMAQQIVKKFRAYDTQIKQSSKEYKVSVSPPRTSTSPEDKESKASKNEPKVFKSVADKPALSKASKKTKTSVQGSLSSVHSGRESFLPKKVGTPRRADF